MLRCDSGVQNDDAIERERDLRPHRGTLAGSGQPAGLTPGRYVGSPESDEDEEPFEEKMPRLVAELERQFAEGREWKRRFAGSFGMAQDNAAG